MLIETIRISSIRRDVACQPRVDTDNTMIEEYADAMKDGATFPPIVTFFDGKTYWLADGFYRTAASESAGKTEIAAEVHQGDRRAAILHSVGVNSLHGMRRTNSDKRRAISTLLNDPEWSGWSDSEIARRCGVSQPSVGKLRYEMAPQENSTNRQRQVSRSGKTYQLNTARVGSAKRAASPVSRTTEGAQEMPASDLPERQIERDIEQPSTAALSTSWRSAIMRLWDAGLTEDKAWFLSRHDVQKTEAA